MFDRDRTKSGHRALKEGRELHTFVKANLGFTSKENISVIACKGTRAFPPEVFFQ